MPTKKTAEKTGDKPAKPAAKTTSPPAKTVKPKAAAKPAVKAAAKAPAKSTAPRKAASKASGEKPPLNPEQRRYYVEVAAYYIAERRGFHGGSELNDWVQAEAEIDRLLREGILNP